MHPLNRVVSGSRLVLGVDQILPEDEVHLLLHNVLILVVLVYDVDGELLLSPLDLLIIILLKLERRPLTILGPIVRDAHSFPGRSNLSDLRLETVPLDSTDGLFATSFLALKHIK